MNLIPPQFYWIAIAALTVVVGVQEVRVQRAQAETSKVKLDFATDQAQRQEVARKLIEENGRLQTEHAAKQQELETRYAKQKTDYENRRRADAATVGRLRDQLATYTARGDAPDHTEPVACQRAGDRLEALGGLFAEGVELVVEGRGIVERRDAEVIRLLGQIGADRAACSPALKAGTAEAGGGG
jgi:hypothetical protein